MTARRHLILPMALVSVLCFLAAVAGCEDDVDTLPVSSPVMQVIPEVIDFGNLYDGESATSEITVQNTGSGYLIIKGFGFSGSPYFTVLIGGQKYQVSHVSENGVKFGLGIVVEPNDTYTFEIEFAPMDDERVNAALELHTNDGNQAHGSTVLLVANESIPVMAVIPQAVEFGGREVGELATVPLVITSRSTQPLIVYGISLLEGSSSDFSLGLDGLDHLPTVDDPIVVPYSGDLNVTVFYTPDEENPANALGSPILDEGTILIESNSFHQAKEVAVSGYCGDFSGPCPTAVIHCAEGNEVIPQTALHLFGNQSYAAFGSIAKWDWSVEQPLGSQSVFIPSNDFPNPTFEVNVAGKYTFNLTVYDEDNISSCAPDTFEVVVIPDEAIHIELLWHTPDDPDEPDEGPEAGADLDLHFAHPWAGGPDLDGDGQSDGWFDLPFDCFFYNDHPEWGSFDPSIADNPGLDADDTNGEGPENINLNIPDDVVYRVGVHYWNDHGFGPSYATLLVFIYSQLVFEIPDVKLVDEDMWEVCTLEWPSGKVQVVTDPMGQYKITHDYVNPYFGVPGKPIKP